MEYMHKIRRRNFQKKFNVVFIQLCWIGIVLKFLCDKQKIRRDGFFYKLYMFD
jgi:hypothetical protein